MNNQIILAKKAMRLANRVERKPLMPQVLKMPQSATHQKGPSINKTRGAQVHYSQYIEKAVLTTLILGVMSVFYSQFAFLAGTLSLLIIAAIIDKKLDYLQPVNAAVEIMEKPASLNRKFRSVDTKSQRQLRDSESYIPFDVTEVGGETLTMTVFPYKKTM